MLSRDLWIELQHQLNWNRLHHIRNFGLLHKLWRIEDISSYLNWAEWIDPNMTAWKKNKFANSKLEGKYKIWFHYFNHNSIQNLQSLWESWWIRPHAEGSLRWVKGQIISKCLFVVFNFIQKTNENKLTRGFLVAK